MPRPNRRKILTLECLEGKLSPSTLVEGPPPVDPTFPPVIPEPLPPMPCPTNPDIPNPMNPPR